jgi:DNA repair exonuclease SbcCD ATPase subunit
MAGQLPLPTIDDPTQNLDSEHKEAFSKLVSNLIEDFQVIIATEDDETKDFLKKYCNQATYYELEKTGNPVDIPIIS